MSGTSLILLAMYSTVNVVGGTTHSSGNYIYLLAFLMAAVSLTLMAMFLSSVPQRRTIPKGSQLPRVQRRLTGPGVRRR